MRLLLGALLALLSVQTAQGMSCSSTVGGVKYDLSSLTGTTVFYESPTTTFNYYINPCGSVAASTCSANGQAFVCQVRKTPINQFESVVAYSDDTNHPPAAVWSNSQITPGSGVVITFINGDPCNLRTRTAIVDFYCDTTGQKTATVVESPQCTFQVNYPTKIVCPGNTPGGGGGNGGGGDGGGGSGSEESKGLSGGWIFIIILLVGTVVAFGAGIVYKRQKLGAQGVESVPLIDFWRELPGLVKDGCRFTYVKIAGLCGGKSGGSTEPYETIK